jgi:hypothetical protein
MTQLCITNITSSKLHYDDEDSYGEDSTSTQFNRAKWNTQVMHLAGYSTLTLGSTDSLNDTLRIALITQIRISYIDKPMIYLNWDAVANQENTIENSTYYDEFINDEIIINGLSGQNNILLYSDDDI